MRLFVAVELAEHVRRAADETARALQRQLRDTLRARWVAQDKMHLTVRFIGQVSDESAPGIIQALRAPIPIEPFDIALGECGIFPAVGRPRVLWIGIEEGLPSLTAIHAECNRRLLPLGFEPEDRPYRAHLTLARVNDAARNAAALTREAISALRVPDVRCSVHDASVFESRLSPRGSTYRELIRIPLHP